MIEHVQNTMYFLLFYIQCTDHSYTVCSFRMSLIVQRVVREMNRLGMMADISHVNNYTMVDVLDNTLAPGECGHTGPRWVWSHWPQVGVVTLGG